MVQGERITATQTEQHLEMEMEVGTMAIEELTDKQQKFVQEYLIDLNATQAAIRAGYSKKNADKIGSELLGKTRVAEAVRKAQDKLAKKTEITQEWIIANLKKVFERCMQEEAVTDKNGNFTGVFEFRDSGANRALELLGKHLGMFAERVKHSNDEGKPFTVNVTTAIDERISQMLGREE